MKQVLTTLYCCLGIAVVSLSSCGGEPAPNRVAARFHAEEVQPDFQQDLSKRKVFPYSVAPGGAFNRKEAVARAEADPVIRDHYKDIQLPALRPFRLTKPAEGFVSYRIGNRVFWTSRRLYLKPGEMLLSDGKNVIRSRCGNRISDQPQEPVLPGGEPSQALLDQPSWEAPAFTAFTSPLPLFALPPNSPSPSRLEYLARVPDEAFPVSSGSPGPGLIGGPFPGGLVPARETGEIVLERGYWWLFPWAPRPLEIPFFQVPAWRPIFPVTLPPPIASAPDYLPLTLPLPILLAELPQQFASLPTSLFPGSPFHPWTQHPFTIGGGSPITVPLNNPKLPVLDSFTPPAPSRPHPSEPSPETETPPPSFIVIPEPRTSSLMMGVAAFSVGLFLKQQLWQRREQRRSSGGRPLRSHTPRA